MPVTPERRQYILNHLAKPDRNNWIRISEYEFDEFGGRSFFTSGVRCEYVHDSKWFTTNPGQRGWTQTERVQLPWKIHAPDGGWSPYQPYYTTTSVTSTTITLANTLVSGQPQKGKQVREHHIDRERLVAQVNANKETYGQAYAKFKALYTDEVEALTQKHLDGLIGTNQIVVKDKDGNAITILADMSKTFDDQLRELELDSREVVILDHEEYGQFVEGYATNLKQVQATAEKLEELQ